MVNKFISKLILVGFPILFFSLFSCKETHNIGICEDPLATEFEKSDMCNPKIASFHFGLEELTIPEQIEFLMSHNIDGLTLRIASSNLDDLNEYYQEEGVKNGTFNIYSIFTPITLNDSEELENQLATIEEIYSEISCKNTLLQVIVNGEKNSENATATLTRIADIATSYEKELIIYPHDETAIETAEEALFYINSSQKSNIFLSVHLCHELAAGNGERMEEVVNNVAPYIKAISISGATESEHLDSSLPSWYWGIKPLYMGSYEYSKFYSSLYSIDYNGPIGIHTFGILDNFNLPMNEHLPRSREILLNLGEDLCN